MDYREELRYGSILNIPMRPLNVVGPIAFTSSDDPTFDVPCRIEEYWPGDKLEYGGRISSYKVKCVSLWERFGTEDFYTSDLESLIKEGQIKIRLR